MYVYVFDDKNVQVEFIKFDELTGVETIRCMNLKIFVSMK